MCYDLLSPEPLVKIGIKYRELAELGFMLGKILSPAGLLIGGTYTIYTTLI
jgi:hypothetical protein